MANDTTNTISTKVEPGSVSEKNGILGYGAGGAAIYAPSPSNVLTSQNLAPVKEFKLPEATPNTGGAGLEAYISSNNKSIAQNNIDTLLAQEKANKDEIGSTLKTTLDSILGTNNEIANVGSSVDRTAQNTAKMQADEYTSKIEAEALSNRRQLELLQKSNPEGLFGGALQDRMEALNRASVSKQADYAIIQNSALRNYETASAIADRQVQLKLEPLKAKLDNLKFFYSENKNDFNRADDRLYSSAVKKADAELKKQESIENDIRNVKLEAAKNGAPASVIEKINEAKDLSQALKAAGNYNSDPLDRAIKQAQLRKLNASDVPKGENLNELLSIKEAQDAGVPYGTTKLQLIAKGSTPNKSVLNTLNDKISIIDGVLQNKAGLRGVVGPNKLARAGLFNFSTFTGSEGDAIAGINQLTNQETLTTLLELKKAGGTLGALSEGEGKLLREAASKINSWSLKDKNGNVYGYKTSESSFNKELNTLKKYTQRAIEAAGGAGSSVQNENDFFDITDSVLQDINSGYLNSGYDLN